MKLLKSFLYSAGLSLFVAALPIARLLAEITPGGDPGNLNEFKGLIKNPLKNNINDFGVFIQVIIEKIVLPIGAVIVVFYIIYAGYLFVTAGGNEEKVKKAKHTFLWVVIGAAVLLGALAIARAIEETLKQITEQGVFPTP